jgi:hypothetical protein
MATTDEPGDVPDVDLHALLAEPLLTCAGCDVLMTEAEARSRQWAYLSAGFGGGVYPYCNRCAETHTAP